jgi:sec-independent protein translocase protein TatA
VKPAQKHKKMNTLFVLPLAIMGWEWLAIALVVLLLFGGKKIPELMRGLGKGVKSFKQGMKEVEGEMNEIKKDIETESENK